MSNLAKKQNVATGEKATMTVVKEVAGNGKTVLIKEAAAEVVTEKVIPEVAPEIVPEVAPVIIPAAKVEPVISVEQRIEKVEELQITIKKYQQLQEAKEGSNIFQAWF